MSLVDEIPHQLSCDEDLPGWRPDWMNIGTLLNILLDGEPSKGVIAYDVDAGTITRFKTDEDGRFIAEGDEAVRETVRGVVEVRWL